jgi:glycerol-3-phosphate dehydrogenase
VVLAEGSRILFVIPWGERVILGTTDTDYQGPLDNPSCDDQDVAYILDVVNASFPKASLARADIVSTWSGLRPLVADPNGNPSDISRRHKIAMNLPGWWDVTGGKLTTYRLMAQETVTALGKYLGVQQQPCRTAATPLLEDAGMAWVSGILPPPVSAAAVSHYCREEGACHLDDVMIRRSSWRHYHRNHAEIAATAAGWMAAELHWTPAQMEDELQRYYRLTGATPAPRPHIHAASNGAVQKNGHHAASRVDASLSQ